MNPQSPLGTQSHPTAPTTDAAPASVPRFRSDHLFSNGVHEVLIEHGTECYRLRRTRQDKLLLHK